MLAVTRAAKIRRKANAYLVGMLKKVGTVVVVMVVIPVMIYRAARASDVTPPDPAASSKALAVTMAGAASMTFGGYTANDLAMFIGAVVGVVGLIVQWYYRHQEYKLKKMETEARIASQGFYGSGE